MPTSTTRPTFKKMMTHPATELTAGKRSVWLKKRLTMRAKTEMKVSKTQILRRHTRHTLMPVANLPTFVLLVGFTRLWLLDPMQLRVQVDPSTQGHQAAEEDRRARARVRAELEEKGRAADMQVLLDQRAMERSSIEAICNVPTSMLSVWTTWTHTFSVPQFSTSSLKPNFIDVTFEEIQDRPICKHGR